MLLSITARSWISGSQAADSMIVTPSARVARTSHSPCPERSSRMVHPGRSSLPESIGSGRRCRRHRALSSAQVPRGHADAGLPVYRRWRILRAWPHVPGRVVPAGPQHADARPHRLHDVVASMRRAVIGRLQAKIRTVVFHLAAQFLHEADHVVDVGQPWQTCNWTGPLAIKAAAICGNAAFFDPSTRMRPLKRLPPVILKPSIACIQSLGVLCECAGDSGDPVRTSSFWPSGTLILPSTTPRCAR